MGAMQQQNRDAMGAMQQKNRDAMDAMQAQIRDARRTADAAAAVYPRLNSVLEGSASAIDEALLEMTARLND
eukprot:2336696-Prymnesium_polylepis.1